MRVPGTRPGRVGVLSLGVALALSIPTATLAGIPVPGVDDGTGKHGKFGYVESAAEPAGTCRYGYHPAGLGEYYNGIRRIAVEPPDAHARAGRATQRITWRLVVQAWVGAESRWVKEGATGWQSRRTSPAEPAAFTKRRLTVDSWPHHGVYDAHRARIELRWYARDNTTITGRARLFPDHYRAIEHDAQFGVLDDHCGSTTG